MRLAFWHAAVVLFVCLAKKCSRRDLRGLSRAIGTGWAVALWLVLAGLSSSAQLHQLLHSDAQSFGHECAVTSLAKDGLILPAPMEPAPRAQFLEVGCAPVAARPDLPLRDLRLAFGRAPPLRFIVSN